MIGSAIRTQLVALAVLIALPATIEPAAASERDHRRGAARERHHAWRGDIRRFNDHDFGRWRSGHWYRGRHAGRSGWWWIVGGGWYYYPTPVYPYPNPYRPPLVLAPPALAATPYWYYCANPAGYYPYVLQCASGWQRVPANVPR